MIAALIDPAYSNGPDPGPAYFGQVASSPVLHEVAGLINLIAALLLIVGLVGVIRLLRGQRGAVGRIGAGLLLVAAVVLDAGTFSTSLTDALADAVLAVGFGAIAWTILSLSNEQWGAWQPLPDRAAGAERSTSRPSETQGSALA